MSLYDKFIAFDDALARNGVPPLGKWWRAGLKRYLDAYERGEVLDLWACVGRGSAKSTCDYKLVTFFALFGAFTVPPGERHYGIVLSRLKEEATKGIDIIAAWLTLLRVPFRIAGDVIELADSTRGIRVCAASVAAASGWRAWFIGLDEYSKVGTGGADDRDAAEIRSSAVAMTATHANAPIVTMGSAWGASGDFYEAITGGTTADRIVLGPAPTWEATDGRITREECQRKERDSRRFAREYGCVFQSGASSIWDIDTVDGAFAPEPPGLIQVGRSVLVIDPSSAALGRDLFTFAEVYWAETEPNADDAFVRDERGCKVVDAFGRPQIRDDWTNAGKRMLCFRNVSHVPPGTPFETIVPMHAKYSALHKIIAVASDQRERMSLGTLYQQARLHFFPYTWTPESKAEAVSTVSRLLTEQRISILPAHPEMRRQMLNFKEQLLSSGRIGYGARTGHDDFPALLLTAAMADADGLLSGSPYRRVNTVTESGVGLYSSPR